MKSRVGLCVISVSDAEYSWLAAIITERIDRSSGSKLESKAEYRHNVLPRVADASSYNERERYARVIYLPFRW